MKIESRFQELASSLNKEEQLETKRAVIYTRVSTKEQAENNASLDTQKKYCVDFAIKKGIAVDAYFGGTYESAKSDERKEFKRMLAFVKKRKNIDTIIVYSYDRFSRTGPNGAYISQELMKVGVKTLSVTQEVDPTTASGQFQQNLYYLFSQFDNELRKDKSVTGMKERLREGYWIYMPPLGYTNLNKGKRSSQHQFIINEDGKLIKKAFMWKKKNLYTNTQIIQKLDKLGLHIDKRFIVRVFQNPFYCGKIINRLIPGEVIEGKHPPLISEADWWKVQDVINGNKRIQCSHQPTDMLPLKVFTKCYKSRDVFTGYLNKKKGIYYYKSRSKGTKVNVNAKKLNKLFSEKLGEYELKESLGDVFVQTVNHLYEKHYQAKNEEQTKIKKQQTELKKKIESVEERFAVGEITQEIFKKYTEKYKSRLAENAKNLETTSLTSSNLQKVIENSKEMTKNLSNTWEEMDFGEKVRLQSFVFPDGILYDKENDRVRTTSVNSIFEVSRYLSENYGHKKSGILSKKDLNSTVVGNEGLEPPTSSV